MIKTATFIVPVIVIFISYYINRSKKNISAFSFFVIVLLIVLMNVLVLINGTNYLPNTTLINKLLIYSIGGLSINSGLDLLIFSLLPLATISDVKDNYLLIFELIAQITVILSVLIGVSDINSNDQKMILAIIMVLALTLSPIMLGIKWKFKKDKQ